MRVCNPCDENGFATDPGSQLRTFIRRALKLHLTHLAASGLDANKGKHSSKSSAVLLRKLISMLPKTNLLIWTGARCLMPRKPHVLTVRVHKHTSRVLFSFCKQQTSAQLLCRGRVWHCKVRQLPDVLLRICPNPDDHSVLVCSRWVHEFIFLKQKLLFKRRRITCCSSKNKAKLSETEEKKTKTDRTLVFSRLFVFHLWVNDIKSQILAKNPSATRPICPLTQTRILLV